MRAGPAADGWKAAGQVPDGRVDPYCPADGLIPGFDDGGDGGLFNGILARYLANTAVRRPELTALAAPLVLAIHGPLRRVNRRVAADASPVKHHPGDLIAFSFGECWDAVCHVR